jgi:hypothetical protein
MTVLDEPDLRSTLPGPYYTSPAMFAIEKEKIFSKSWLCVIFPGFSALTVEAHVRRWPLGLACCFPGRGAIQKALTRPAERIHLAGDYLGTFYTETAVETGWRPPTPSCDRSADLPESGSGASSFAYGP